MVQNKAPIRSQTLGPATLGERSDQIDRSTQRQQGQSQHGSHLAGVQCHLRLSIPAIALATHRCLHAVADLQRPVSLAAILTATIRMV